MLPHIAVSARPTERQATPPKPPNPNTVRLREIEDELSVINTKIEELRLRKQELVSKRQQSGAGAQPKGSPPPGIPPSSGPSTAGLDQPGPSRPGTSGQRTTQSAHPPRSKREYERIRKQEQRLNETPEQREARLQKMRDYSAKRRGSDETPEQREARLKKMKEYIAAKREDKKKQQTNDGKDALEVKKKNIPYSYTREYDKMKKREQRANETPEQRESRLQKMREYNDSRKAAKGTQDEDDDWKEEEGCWDPYIKRVGTAREREKTRERVAAIRARRTPEQVEHDREVSRMGMAKMRGRRSKDEKLEAEEAAFYRKHMRDHDRTCRIYRYRMTVARGEDPGPEPRFTNGELAYCCQCDTDPTVPMSGNGRCPCYHCWKYHGKAEEWCEANGVPYKKK